MKFCLAFAFQNELPWLQLHLPPLLESCALDGVVALDGGSSDGGADYVRECGGVVYERPFDWHFGEHMNALIEACESEGYDAMLRIDPDECLFPEAVDHVALLLQSYKALRLARFNFVGDRLHYYPYKYPDYQTRAFRLGQGVHYAFKVHETLEHSFRGLGWIEDGSEFDSPRDIMRCPHVAIYHYGEIQADERAALKHLNYARLVAGEPVLSELPPHYNVNGAQRFRLPFQGPQPIDPGAVGIRAPLEAIAL